MPPLKLSIPTAAVLAPLLLLIACGDSTGPSGGGGGGGGSGPALTVVIEPGAVLLTAVGETMQLEARVYDVSGAPVSATVTWASNDPGTVSVSSTGLATAAAGLGSAQITAVAKGVSSQPALALVAQPTTDVVLVPDAQIRSDPVAVDPLAEYGPGWQYRIRMEGSAPAPGQLVLGTGGRALAGRVVSASPAGAETELTVEFVALNQLFADLRIDETIPLVEAEGGSGGASLRAREWKPAALDAADTEFTLGRFACTASGAVPDLNLPSPKLELTAELALLLGYDNALTSFAVQGSVSADFEYKPVFKAEFTGKLSCEAHVKTFTLPLSGPLSLFFGIQVPVGIGMELNGKLELAQVGVEVTSTASATATLGLMCPNGAGACTTRTEFEVSRDFTFKPVVPDLEDQFKLELGGYGFLTVKPALGTALTTSGQWEFLAARGGLEQTLDLATSKRQAQDPAYASGFQLVAKASVGAGKDLSGFLDKLRQWLGEEVIPTLEPWEIADTLARSPGGTFTITPDHVAPGDSTTPGELATFRVELDPVTYAGLESVDKVEFRWRKKTEDGSDFTLENARPACSEVQGGSGKTVFECTTDFLEEDAGIQTLHAFVHAKLFGIPLPIPLEVALDAVATVTVGDAECPVPPEWAVASIVDESEISSGEGSATLDGPQLSYLGISGGARTASNGGWSPVPYVDGEVTDFVHIVPLNDLGDLDGSLWAMVQGVGGAEAEIVGGTCCSAYDDGTAEILVWSDWLRGTDPETGLSYEHLIEATAGASWSGDLPRKDTKEFNEVHRMLLGRVWEIADGTRWLEMVSGIEGDARHRGNGNSAIISASLDLTVLDIVDDAGNSVPAQICSAAGFNYGAPSGPVTLGGVRAAASRPTRQVR